MLRHLSSIEMFSYQVHPYSLCVFYVGYELTLTEKSSCGKERESSVPSEDCS